LVELAGTPHARQHDQNVPPVAQHIHRTRDGAVPILERKPFHPNLQRNPARKRLTGFIIEPSFDCAWFYHRTKTHPSAPPRSPPSSSRSSRPACSPPAALSWPSPKPTPSPTHRIATPSPPPWPRRSAAALSP